jgi:hypothetical protein
MKTYSQIFISQQLIAQIPKSIQKMVGTPTLKILSTTANSNKLHVNNDLLPNVTATLRFEGCSKTRIY